MLARATNRGLGQQTKAFYDWMRPDRTLVISMGRDRDPLDEHPDRFDSWDTATPEQLTEDELRPFLDGMDCVWSAETMYSNNVVPVAREMGVRTVCTANYEFMLWLRNPGMPRPDEFWAPSTWHFPEGWPANSRLMPFPVDRSKFPFRLRTKAEVFLHVAGWPTQADRNGTWSTLMALRHVHMPMRVVVTSQHEIPTSLTDRRNLPGCVDLEVRIGDVEDNRTLYEEADVLVLPRRFGGLCLPINEASSLGLAVVTLDRAPENEWVPPEGRVKCIDHSQFEGQPGRITIQAAHDEDLAARMQALAMEPETVESLSRASDAYAASIDWEVQRPRIDAALDALIRGHALG